MVKKQQMTNPLKTSSLERFSLGFEYDKTLVEIKQNVRSRTV